jgi:hypothetical protein
VRRVGLPAGLGSLLLVLILLFCHALAAMADEGEERAEQSKRNTPTRVQAIEQALEGRRHQGPFFLRTGFALERMGYDSNLFNDEDDETDGYTMTLVPEAQVLLPVGPRQLFQAFGKLGLVLNTESPPGNFLNIYGGINYDLYLKRFHLALEDHFLQDKRRQNIEFNRRVRMTNNRAAAEGMLQVATRWHTGLNYSLVTVLFDDGVEEDDIPGRSLSELLDRNEHRFAWRNRYDASSLVSGYVDVGRTDYHFRAPDNIRESSEWSASLGLEMNETAVISGLAEVEYVVFEPELVEDQDFSGVLWNVALTWQMGQRFQLGAESARNRIFSAYADNLYFIYRNDQAVLRMRLRESTWLGLGHAWASSAYPVEGINVGTVDDPQFVAREDRITGPLLTLKHQTGKKAGKQYTIGMETRYLTRDSNAVTNYDRFYVFFSLAVEL